MKFKSIITGVFLCLGFSACIQEEAPNAEADIVSCTLSDPSVLKMPPIITNNTVIIMANSTTDIKTLAPLFKLTEGATINPPSATERDFSTVQKYVVTSQDGLWKKEYKVFVDITNVKTEFNFEHWEIIEGARGKQWHGFYEISNTGQKQSIWATANAGYALTGYVTESGEKLTNPLIYPTTSYEMGYQGKGVRLETKPTGAFGDMMNMPLAAGNLFIGSFNASVAGMGPEQALKATQFGIPMAFNHHPIAFEVWYKYTPGANYQDENKNIINSVTDVFDIYAILYESKDGKRLDGSIQFDDDCIIGIARVKDPEATREYKKLYMPFEYRREPDQKKLSQGEYYTAIVFSSSRDGAYFKGAIGSTLIIDEAKLILEGDK